MATPLRPPTTHHPPSAIWFRPFTIHHPLFTILLALAACTRSEPPPFYRLVDHSSVPTGALVRIDGVQKRVLNPAYPEQSFDLDPVPPEAALVYSVGLADKAAVRFEVEFVAPGRESVSLFGQDFDTPGWTDHRLDLSAYGGVKGRLVLRKKPTQGDALQAQRSVWGDPVILTPAKSPQPGVILISIDTLRADRVGLYGHQVAHTPVLDRMGAEGVWYRHAYSPSTWTLPSHASLFYGRYLESPLHQPQPTLAGAAPPLQTQALAQILRQANYLTAGFTGGGYVSDNFGFSRGFDTYAMFRPPKRAAGDCLPQRFDGPDVFRQASEWLRERSQMPFFLFIHTYDVHDRCPFLPRRGDDFAPWPELSPEDQTRLLTYYDELISTTDAHVGELLAELERLGRAATTLVVVTSDHGELFSEHGLRSHGCAVKPYEELIRVPLVLRYPEVLKPAAITRPVSLLDIAPSILSLLRLPVPSAMTGQVLPGIGLGDPPPAPIYVTCDTQIAIRDGDLKLIATDREGAPSELYDLAGDPTEQRNLAADDRTNAERLQALADTFWQSRQQIQEEVNTLPDLDPQTRERLRDLGYRE